MNLRSFLGRREPYEHEVAAPPCPYYDALCIAGDRCPSCLLDEILGIPAAPIMRRTDETSARGWRG